MRKAKKIVWSVVIGVVVLLVVAVVIVGLSLGSIVKAGIERYGPPVTQTTVTVDGVNVSLFSGSASIKGLVIGNPRGYQMPQAISVGKASVGINPLSIFSDKIVVRSVRVESPEITLEGNPFSGNNLTTIRDNVSGANKEQTQQAAKNQPGPAGKPGKKYEVDEFVITGAKVHVSLSGMGGKQFTVPLPDITLTDLGKGTDGLTATDLAHRVLETLTSGAIKAVAADTTNLGKGAEKLTQQAGKTATDGINKVGKTIGNLFGK